MSSHSNLDYISSLTRKPIDIHTPKEEVPEGFSAKYRMPYMGYLEIGPQGRRLNEAEVVETQYLQIDPMANHYGQHTFEGLIATLDRTKGVIRVFGLDKHFERFDASLQQLSMPQVRKDEFIGLITETLKKNMPSFGKAPRIYIRPFASVNYNQLGNSRDTMNEKMILTVNTIPIGASYYSQKGINKVFLVNATRVNTSVDDVQLGTFRSAGKAKQGGNYAVPMAMKRGALEQGGIDTLFLDMALTTRTLDYHGQTLSVPHPEFYLGEATSSAPLVLRRDGVIQSVVGPSSLDSVTQYSLLELARLNGYKTKTEPLKLEVLLSGDIQGFLLCGTAATGVKVDEMSVFGGQTLLFPDNEPLLKLAAQLSAIKSGEVDDCLGMITEIEM